MIGYRVNFKSPFSSMGRGFIPTEDLKHYCHIPCKKDMTEQAPFMVSQITHWPLEVYEAPSMANVSLAPMSFKERHLVTITKDHQTIRYH